MLHSVVTTGECFPKKQEHLTLKISGMLDIQKYHGVAVGVANQTLSPASGQCLKQKEMLVYQNETANNEGRKEGRTQTKEQCRI